jgi:hypothetical protein
MFKPVRMELQVREEVARGARLRARAAFWTVASVALGVAGVSLAGIAAGGRTNAVGVVMLALAAFAGATPLAVWGYWGWRDVRRGDGRIVELVSTFAGAFVASRIDAPERSPRRTLRTTEDVPDVLARERVTTAPAAASNGQPLTARGDIHEE